MSRRPNLIPSIMLNVALPQDVHTRLTLYLFSELEGRVPLGAYQRFFTERVREFFQSKQLDLSPYIGGEAPAVSGSPDVIRWLEETLERK